MPVQGRQVLLFGPPVAGPASTRKRRVPSTAARTAAVGGKPPPHPRLPGSQQCGAVHNAARPCPRAVAEERARASRLWVTPATAAPGVSLTVASAVAVCSQHRLAAAWPGHCCCAGHLHTRRLAVANAVVAAIEPPCTAEFTGGGRAAPCIQGQVRETASTAPVSQQPVPRSRPLQTRGLSRAIALASGIPSPVAWTVWPDAATGHT